VERSGVIDSRSLPGLVKVTVVGLSIPYLAGLSAVVTGLSMFVVGGFFCFVLSGLWYVATSRRRKLKRSQRQKECSKPSDDRSFVEQVEIRWRSRDAISFAPLFGFMIISALGIFRFLGFPKFGGPRSTSVDAAHNYEVVRWIVRFARPPGRAETYLDSMQHYPYAAHLSTAFWSQVFRIHPLRAMAITGLFFVTASLAVTSQLVVAYVRVIGWRAWSAWGAVCTPFVLPFFAPRLFFGAITDDFFFSQLAGILCAVCLICVVAWIFVALGSERRVWSEGDGPRVPDRLSIGVLSMLLMLSWLLLATYPTHSIVSVVAIIVLFLDWRRSKNRVCLSAGVAILFGTVVGVLVELPEKMGTNNALASRDGSAAPMLLTTFGGLVPLGLVVLGLVVLAAGLYRASSGSGAALHLLLFGSALGPLAVALGMNIFHSGIGPFSGFASYAIRKNFYLAAPFCLCLASLGFGIICARIKPKRRGALDRSDVRQTNSISRSSATPVGAGVCAALSLLIVGVTPFITNVFHPAIGTPSIAALAFMETATNTTNTSGPTPGKPGNVGAIGSTLSSYFVYETTFHRLNKDESLAIAFGDNPWTDWPRVRNGASRLVVQGNALIELFSKRPGVTILAQRGNVALLGLKE
jgi:hypothetical protein